MQSVKDTTAIKQTSMASACADKLSAAKAALRPSKFGGGAHEFSAARPGQRSWPTFIVGHNHIHVSLFG